VINLRDLLNQVVGLRTDISAGQGMAALEESAIKLARDTNLLKGTTLATLASGASSLAIPIPPGRDLCRVDLVEFRNPSLDAQWRRVAESAKVFLDGKTLAPDTALTGRSPAGWALRSSVLSFPDPADADYPLRITYAWAPARFAPQQLPFPPDAEDALTTYAAYLVYRLAGKERNLDASFLSLKQYRLCLPDLRAMADTGESGARSVFEFLPQE